MLKGSSQVGIVLCTALRRQYVSSQESNQKYKAMRAPKVQDLLARASDWELRFDLAAPKYGQHKRPQFPIEVVEASQIPDGVIWSTSAKAYRVCVHDVCVHDVCVWEVCA